MVTRYSRTDSSQNPVRYLLALCAANLTLRDSFQTHLQDLNWVRVQVQGQVGSVT